MFRLFHGISYYWLKPLILHSYLAVLRWHDELVLIETHWNCLVKWCVGYIIWLVSRSSLCAWCHVAINYVDVVCVHRWWIMDWKIIRSCWYNAECKPPQHLSDGPSTVLDYCRWRNTCNVKFWTSTPIILIVKGGQAITTESRWNSFNTRAWCELT